MDKVELRKRITVILTDYIPSASKIERIQEVLNDDAMQDEGEMPSGSMPGKTEDFEEEVEAIATDLSKQKVQGAPVDSGAT
ncbi:MAG TPA: hypothetical protein P5244_04215 [Syntrophales bacterium]|nr:hypothetical protein [Syntrophales bacterium]